MIAKRGSTTTETVEQGTVLASVFLQGVVSRPTERKPDPNSSVDCPAQQKHFHRPEIEEPTHLPQELRDYLHQMHEFDRWELIQALIDTPLNEGVTTYDIYLRWLHTEPSFEYRCHSCNALFDGWAMGWDEDEASPFDMVEGWEYVPVELDPNDPNYAQKIKDGCEGELKPCCPNCLPVKSDKQE